MFTGLIDDVLILLRGTNQSSKNMYACIDRKYRTGDIDEKV